MNSVVLIGRLARDPELRYTPSQTAVCRFTVAVDRFARSGEERTADFISCVAFGKQAEFCNNYFQKGKLIGVQGRIQTGSYQNKDGQTVYTTDVVADRLEFVGSKDESSRGGARGGNDMGFGAPQAPKAPSAAPVGFSEMPDDDDLPF